MNRFLSIIQNFYNTYSPMLYGIALEISSSKEEASRLLIDTFQKINKQKLVYVKSPTLYITLVKLIFQTAEQLKSEQSKDNFIPKSFENTPLLHKLLGKQVSLEDYCKENELNQFQIAQKIRQEFRSIRNLKNKYL